MKGTMTMLRTFYQKGSNKFYIFYSTFKWMTFCLLLLSISCSYIKPNLQNLDYTSIEDLHVQEEIMYPDSPFDVLVQKSFSKQQHFINILDLGDDALLSRIHLIRQAKKAIYIQTFIWKGDESCRFLAYELIQAAKRGVKVKVLVDYIVVPKDPAQIAFMSTVHPNLEIKLYNPFANKIRPSKLTFLKKVGFEFKISIRECTIKFLLSMIEWPLRVGVIMKMIILIEGKSGILMILMFLSLVPLLKR